MNAYRIFMNSIGTFIRKRRICKIIANTMSLQVLCSPLLNKSWTHHPGKRVLPFTSSKKYRASMTVEAAFVLPLFIFLSIALLAPMKALDTERKIRTVMENCCGELSLSTYMENPEYVDVKNRERKTEKKNLETGYANVISGTIAWLQLQGKLKAFGETVVINSVQAPDENGDITLEVTYKERISFFSRVGNGLSTEILVKRRSWTGFDGKIRTGEGGGGSNENSEEMVYVGKNMGRYHRDRNCHYISNAYQAVSVDEAKAMRDADGHRFTACTTCEEKIGKSGTVYVTAGGRHYHGGTDCSAMVSYVRKVPISEVFYLGACSYCCGE